MKLGYCPACKDIIKLTPNVRECSCGKISGFTKEIQSEGVLIQLATITGPMKVIGINDKSFYEAIEAQSGKKSGRGSGSEFIAFILPRINKSVIKIKKDPAAPPVWTHGSYEQFERRAKQRSPYLPKLETEPVVISDEKPDPEMED
jgi:hypothetical protein